MKWIQPLGITLFLLMHYFGFSQSSIPHLEKKGNATQLLVHDQPFLILGGELGNSSATSMEYMETAWPKLKAMHLNTVLAPVYWELIEQKEGEFNFQLLDDLIEEARNNELKLILLWFGSWKNSMSSHAPGWVKTDQKRFPRAKNDQGRSQEILTPFSDQNLQADLKAFEALMQHLKDFDGEKQTVIMVQVENEIGMLPSARDYHSLANKAFENEVPQELLAYLQKHKATLSTELDSAWAAHGNKKAGNWQQVFGEGAYTDELFMAWNFALYTNQITEAGKAIYPLPMFVNAALNRPGAAPGAGYPSAGPLPHVIDVWKAGTPAIDFYSPDFYNPRFKHWNDLYTLHGNPLFIPEHRFDETVAAKAAYAIGHYEALGFSPFSIESTDDAENEPLGKMYEMMEQLSAEISSRKGQNQLEGVLFDKSENETIIKYGDFEFTCRHDYTLGWSPHAEDEQWPATGALIIQTGANSFIMAGTGVVVTFQHAKNKANNIGILSAEEGKFVDGTWKPGRRLNGDQIHQGRHIRIPEGSYTIQKFSLYEYK